MGLSQTSAVFVLLFVTFLWGSWFQAVKHTGNYPIYVFLNWMYLFSVVIVWGAIFIFEDKMIPDGVFNEIASDPGRVALVFLCGAVYAVGMQIQLSAVSRVGLILSSSITSTCSILSGVIVSAILGGVPEGASLTMIMMSAVLLIGGTVVCQISGTMRDKDIKKGENKKTPLATKKQDIILLIFASGILQPFFSIASSVGLKTDLRPEGFSSFTCMGILCLGAFVGTACRKCEAAGGNGLFCGDDKTGEVKAALIPSKFLGAGRNKSSICCENLRRGNYLKRFTYYAAP